MILLLKDNFPYVVWSAEDKRQRQGNEHPARDLTRTRSACLWDRQCPEILPFGQEKKFYEGYFDFDFLVVITKYFLTNHILG